MSRVESGLSTLFQLMKMNPTFSQAILPYIKPYIEDRSLEYSLQTGNKEHRCDIQYPTPGKREQKGKKDFDVYVDNCVQAHLSLTKGDLVYGFIIDIDNHINLPMEEVQYNFSKLLKELVIKPTLICKSPSGTGFHLYFFFKNPIDKILYKEFRKILLENPTKSVHLLEMKMSTDSKDFKTHLGFEIMLKASAFINQSLYLERFKTQRLEKVVMENSGMTVSSPVVISKEQFLALKEAFKLTTTTVNVDLVFKTAKLYLDEQGLLEGTELADLDFVNDDINGFVRMQKGEFGMFINFYSNAAAKFVATYFCKMDDSELNHIASGSDFIIFANAIEVFLKEIGIEFAMDNGNLYCSHSCYTYGEYVKLEDDAWKNLTEQELNNLYLGAKVFAKRKDVKSELSKNEFLISIEAIASTNLKSMFIQKLNMYETGYLNARAKDKTYDPFRSIAAFWPNKEVRNRVALILKQALWGILLQYIFGQDMMKRNFIQALGITELTEHLLDMDGNLTSRGNTIKLQSLFGTYFNKLFLIFKGTTNIGKSTFIKALFSAFNDLVYITNGRPIDDRDKVQISKCLVMLIPELESLESKAVETIKSITGSSSCAIRYLFGEVAKVLRTASLCSDSNHTTGLSSDKAMSTRLLPLPEPSYSLLFCNSPYDYENPERHPELYSNISNNQIFRDIWGMIWNQLKSGKIVLTMNPKLEAEIVQKNDSEMYKPLFCEIIDRFIVDIEEREAIEANNKEQGFSKPYYIIEDSLKDNFISNVIRTFSSANKQYIKKSDEPLVTATINRYGLGDKTISVCGREIRIFKVILVNPHYRAQ